MTTSQLSALLRTRINDLRGEILDDAQALPYLNQAYQDVVNEYDRIPRVNRLAPVADVVIASGAQEADLPSDLVRVVDVRRMDGTEEDRIEEIAYGERNKAWGALCFYLIRTDLGVHRIGLSNPATEEITLRVRHVRELPPLTSGSSVPTAIPPPHHELIATRAALLYKADNPGLDIGNLAGTYAEALRRMQQLEGPGIGDRSRSKVWR